jgi:sarcosine oxidase subunit gamma
MSESMTHRHGLEPFIATLPTESSGDDCVTVDIRADLGHINLSGSPANPAFLTTVASVLGQELPLAANTMTMGHHRIFWLGPDEWQIVTAIDACSELHAQLRKALAEMHASVSDLSGGQIALHLSGSRVRDVLAKACTLDLAPDKFGVGASAQSGLAKASMLIGLIGDAGPTFEIVVRRSFADYVVRWLQHAATEYGVRFRTTR